MEEKDSHQLFKVFLTYKGRIFSSVLGVITGLLVLWLGWIKALSFLVCVLVGYGVGKKLDDGGELKLPRMKNLFQKRRFR